MEGAVGPGGSITPVVTPHKTGGATIAGLARETVLDGEAAAFEILEVVEGDCFCGCVDGVEFYVAESASYHKHQL